MSNSPRCMSPSRVFCFYPLYNTLSLSLVHRHQTKGGLMKLLPSSEQFLFYQLEKKPLEVGKELSFSPMSGIDFTVKKLRKQLKNADPDKKFVVTSERIITIKRIS